MLNIQETKKEVHNGNDETKKTEAGDKLFYNHSDGINSHTAYGN